MAFRVLRTHRGYDAREVVSALQKEVRRSNPDAALYWAMELHQSGYEDWLWKRLRVIDVEDVSPVAGTHAELDALYLRAQDFKKKKSDPVLNRICAIQAVLLLVAADKNRMADLVLYTHGSDNMPRREIPDYALDEHTLRGKRKGRGTLHFQHEAALLIQPDDSARSREHENMVDELETLQKRYKAIRLMQLDPEQRKHLPQNPWQSKVEAGLPAEDSENGNGDEPKHLPGIGSRTLPGPAPED